MDDNSNKSTARKGFLTLPIIPDVLIVAVIAIVGWKLITAEFKIDIADFGFSDLLALILALFSVWLSIAFYFKATDASNQFYDNTYRFTKEMSEMLGRIEAGFGEKLKHLDEGYSGIREKFDRMPAYSQITNADVKKEEEEIRQKEQEQKALIEGLAEKAKLAEGEKKELFANLSLKSEELEQARMELRRLQRSTRSTQGNFPDRAMMTRYLINRLRNAEPEIFFHGSEINSEIVRNTFKKIAPTLPRAAVRDLQRVEILDEDGELTREGTARIQMNIKHSSSEEN